MQQWDIKIDFGQNSSEQRPNTLSEVNYTFQLRKITRSFTEGCDICHIRLTQSDDIIHQTRKHASNNKNVHITRGVAEDRTYC